ncbi:DUF983 domain-containing protein [Leeuwenhoekiella sp. MAR_2009_132]|uniref:DUF983 domain-containing protein n=1 Tax=Leeuwenhoekiella sp. MAR_2009_132 TaxID=1392489 RepID=UPI00049045CA|nr:DUF983 domain-containing protein [Leeuwenhoekiella sp. MAR_2009_132]
MKKLLQGNPLYSILTGTCPVCQQKSMYENPNPYILTDTLKMHERCLHCNTKFKIEPSFFYGAMYVSYGVGIAFAVAAFVITHFFVGAGLVAGFISIIITLLVFAPIIMRLSRNIWINFFFNYDEEKAKGTTKTS